MRTAGGLRNGRRARAIAVAAALVAGLVTAAGAVAGDSGAGTGSTQPWAQRALALQYELTGDVGYRDAPWVGTHNSFNSPAEVGSTPSANDSNQQITIVDQLELGIRSIELDLHWFNRPGSIGREVVVCHARGESEGHAGCTIEPTLDRILDPIVGWLRDPAHRDQVINVHLQDELANVDGYNAAAAILTERLGSLLYLPAPPAGGGCAELPLDLSRDDVRAAGAQVVLVSDCGPGSAWPGVIFDWREPHEESRPLDYRDYPECDQELPRSTYDEKLVRYYEDSTDLTEQGSQAGALERRDRITAETAARMARCGVDLIDLDQVVPADPRFEALVWSWAPDQPRRGRCAVQRVSASFQHGRWRSRPCGRERHVACRNESGAWEVPRRKVAARKARALCRRRDARHAVPRSGYEVQLLREQMEGKGLATVLLGHRKRDGDWRALDGR